MHDYSVCYLTESLFKIWTAWWSCYHSCMDMFSHLSLLKINYWK